MNTLVEKTKQFQKDRQNLDTQVRNRVDAALTKLAGTLATSPSRVRLHSPFVVRLKGGLDSSLYALRVNPKYRVLLTVDDDPIFDRTTMTLLRVVKRDELDRAFKSAAESLYQDLILREEP